jgi:hypothetical protein
MLAPTQIEALHACRIDLPTAGRSDPIDSDLRTEDHAVLHLDQTPPSHGLNDLGVQPLVVFQTWIWMEITPCRSMP